MLQNEFCNTSVYAGSVNSTRKGARLLLVAALFVATTLFAAATFFSLHSFLQSFMQPFLQDFLSSFLQHFLLSFLSSFLQHFLLSFLQQVSFLSACFTSCAAALRPKERRAANARHLAAAFALNSFMLSVFCGCMNVICQINLFYSGKSMFFF